MTKDEYGDFVLRYKGCGACFPMYHTLSRFEKMWFTAIQKDVADLEKENAELKTYRLNTMAKEQTEMSKYALDLEHKLSWYDTQLTNAKELLKDITSSYGSTEVSEAQLYLKIKKAEQFLKEEA